MANIRVRSTDGSNADNGSTWALAKATLAGADAIDAAGDSIWVSQAHSEASASSITLSLAGTIASPTKVIACNDSADPPTTLVTGVEIVTTGTAQIIVNGSAHIYGLTFKVGSGASAASWGSATASQRQVFENCEIWLANTNAGSVLAPAEAGSAFNHWKNVNVKFGHASQKIASYGPGSTLWWTGGGVLSGSSSPTVLLDPNAQTGMTMLLEGVDLSNCGTGMNITNQPATYGSVTLRNCKLPSGWAGALLNTTITTYSRAAMYNCDGGSTTYKVWIEMYQGTIRDEATIVRTGGASDGTTTLSWKMTSNANAAQMFPLPSDKVSVWNATVGSPITVTHEIVHDSATALTDEEVWIEVEYLGAAGPLSTTVTDARTSTLTAAANQTASSVTWTTTGLTTPNKQALSVTFTPQVAGPFRSRVMLGKASKTIYVDPQPVVS